MAEDPSEKSAPTERRAFASTQLRSPLARVARSDAAMFGVFYAWILAWLHPYMNLPFHWDAVGYVAGHTHEIYDHPWLPFVTGYFDAGHPTLVFWLAALLWRVFGVNLWAPRLLTFAFGATLLLYTYKAGKRLGLGSAGALIAPITLSLTPLVASQTAQFQLDIPLTALFAASAYYTLRSSRPVRLALFGTAMVLCKLTGILLLIPLMAFALAVSVSRNRLTGWRAHVRSQLPYLFPLLALALFFALRRACTGVVFAKTQVNQVGLSLDLRSFLAKVPSFVRSFSFLNDAYLLLPILLLALLLFWRPGRPALPGPSPEGTPVPLRRRAGISWMHFFFLGLSALVLFTVPHVLRAAFSPLPRYFLPYLFFLHLGTAWALARFWQAWKPAGAFLFLFLCAVLLFHWDPKHGDRACLRAFRPLLQNQWVLTSVRSGEETFEWVDYVRVTKRMMDRIERKYPSDCKVIAVYPESDELRRPDCGYIRQPHPVCDAPTLSRFQEAVTRRQASLCLVTSHSHPEYGMEEACKKMSLRLVKRYERRNAWCALYEVPAAAHKEPSPVGTK
jgi:hypothetical protein